MKYITPTITIINIENSKLLCSSQSSEEDTFICGESCKLWHICLDRDKMKRKICLDWQSKYY